MLLYTVVLGVLALLLCELTVRVRASLRYGHAGTGGIDTLKRFDADSGLSIPTPGYRRAGALVNVNVNSLGFRGQEFTAEKPQGVIRVACLGASTTFCAEASRDEMSWPHRLQEILRARCGSHIEVINAGVPGYTVEESLRNLTHRVLRLNPDIIIVYHGNNDIVKDTRSAAIKAGLVQEGEGQQPEWIAFLSRYSLLVDLVAKNLAIQSGGSSRKLTEIPPDLSDRFVTTLGEIHQVAKDNGISLVLSGFVTKYRPGQDRDTQGRNADVAFFYMPWMTIDGLLDAVAMYNSAILSFADAHDVPVIREIESIPADENHFADCMHLRDAGCEVMAQRFADFLIEEALIQQLGDETSTLRGSGTNIALDVSAPDSE